MARRRNYALLRALVTKLRRLRHEEHYDQGVFVDKTSCGTAACIAGQALLMAGYKPAVGGASCDFIDPKGRVGFAQDQAINLLGLTPDEAEILFTAEPGGRWPDKFARRWDALPSTRRSRKALPPKKRPSRIAADLLEAFIKTRGKVLREAIERMY